MAAPLSYRLFGSTARIPLVLLHAYPLDGGMWGDVITHLHAEARHIPVVTVDAPGFGDSPVGPEVARVLGRSEEPSLETYVEALDQTIAALNIDKIVLAGLSLGGYAALAYAEHYGDKIIGLALLDTKAEADEEAARQARLETARNVIANGTEVIAGSINAVLGPTSFERRPEVVEHLRREIAQAPAEGVAWIQRAMAARQGRAHVLAQLNVEGLVLRGAEDSLSSDGAAEAMAKALGTTVITLPGVGHMAGNEAPAEVARALLDLYQRATITG